MIRNEPGRQRRWWLVEVITLAGVTAAVPVAAVVVSQSVGRTAVATNAEGTERMVYWRD